MAAALMKAVKLIIAQELEPTPCYRETYTNGVQLVVTRI
jgi:hypothetical protein